MKNEPFDSGTGNPHRLPRSPVENLSFTTVSSTIIAAAGLDAAPIDNTDKEGFLHFLEDSLDLTGELRLNDSTARVFFNEQPPHDFWLWTIMVLDEAMGYEIEMREFLKPGKAWLVRRMFRVTSLA